jgi:hypothetical protein
MFEFGHKALKALKDSKNIDNISKIREVKLVASYTENNSSDLQSIANSIYIVFDGENYSYPNMHDITILQKWAVVVNLKNEHSQTDIYKISQDYDIIESAILKCLNNEFNAKYSTLKKQYSSITHYSSTFLQVKIGFDLIINKC